jgi:hypothetical protein
VIPAEGVGDAGLGNLPSGWTRAESSETLTISMGLKPSGLPNYPHKKKLFFAKLIVAWWYTKARLAIR